MIAGYIFSAHLPYASRNQQVFMGCTTTHYAEMLGNIYETSYTDLLARVVNMIGHIFFCKGRWYQKPIFNCP
jgi:hypothetical protein